MGSSVKVFSPATIANVGPGFDVIGFALDEIGEEIIVQKNSDGQHSIKPINGFPDIPVDPKKNVATVAVQAMLKALELNDGFDFEFIKNIKPGSGLGTSASSSSGAVFAVNELLERPFTKHELVQFAMEGEKYPSNTAHADNVAPTIFGGFQLVRGYDPLDVISLHYPENIYVSVIHPQVEVKTSEARKILKNEVALSKAITQCGNLAGLIAGLHQKDVELIGRSMNDVIVEPVRSTLIPNYSEVKKAVLDSGAFGCSIAGSGPSIFAFSDRKEKAKSIIGVMESVYDDSGIDTITYVSKIGKEGAKVIG